MRQTFTSIKGLGVTALAVVSMFLLATAAGAVSGDRNGDGISDRWAKKHGLKANVNQANRDQDRDRVKNICEFEARMDPRDRNSDNDRRSDGREDSDRDGVVNLVESKVGSGCGEQDSDDDGVDDGDEVSGYVQSLDGDDLSIRMVNGTILTAPLAEYAYIHCSHDEYAEKPKKPKEPGDDDDPVEPDSVDAAQGDGYEPDPGDCGREALVPGRVVKAFYVEDGMFVKVKLILGS